MKTIKIACIVFIIASITWGCNQDSSGDSGSKQDTKQKQVQQTQAPALQAPTGEVDKFGRKPGDPHYGHNHGSEGHQPATQLNTPSQITPTGEPDKYGRKPGDPHYGHNHE